MRRLVQESVSFLYADGGDGWIAEDSPLDINPRDRAGVGGGVARAGVPVRGAAQRGAPLRHDRRRRRPHLLRAAHGAQRTAGRRRDARRLGPSRAHRRPRLRRRGGAVRPERHPQRGRGADAAGGTLVAGYAEAAGRRTTFMRPALQRLAGSARAAHPVAARESNISRHRPAGPHDGPTSTCRGSTSSVWRHTHAREGAPPRRSRRPRAGAGWPRCSARRARDHARRPARPGRSGPRVPRTTGSARRSCRTTADLSTPYD